MAGTVRLAVGLTCLLVLLVVVNVAAQAVKLFVEYPQSASNNYSKVELTCTDIFHNPLPPPPAVFKLNNTLITTDFFSDLEHNQEMNQITFSFNQDQEGAFFCEHDIDRSGVFVWLAGM